MVFVGTGSQTGTAIRWGDYSMMAIDPVDDCTFWYTTEYLQTTGTNPWRTRIGASSSRPAAVDHRHLHLRHHRHLHLRHLHLRLRHLRHLRLRRHLRHLHLRHHRRRHRRRHLHHRRLFRHLRHLRHPTTTTTSATTAAATTASSGALPRAAGDRADARSGPDTDPQGQLLRGPRSSRSLAGESAA